MEFVEYTRSNKYKMKRVVVVGSSNTDLIGYCERYPQPGETILGKEFHTGFGGKGANQCIMASKFNDVEVSMVGFLGHDQFGDSTLQNYKDNGVNTSQIHFCNLPTGVAMITVDKTAQNQIIVIPGANEALTPQFISTNANDIFKKGDIVVCQNEIPLEATYETLKQAKQHGCLTLWNPAPAPKEIDRNIIKYVDTLIVNTNESMQIGGENTPEESALKLHKEFGVLVIVTLGDKGCLIVGEEQTKIDSVRVNAIDTTGAGDAFVGSYARCWAIGIDPKKSAEISVRIASDSVTRHGTQSSYPNKEQIQKIISEIN
ncbi:ribokinase, putative [Entamoeba nuttalli P19]|uniref:Ribokinase n=2 Tax=Entamoeba nuttalli TaxID=412467 RepID=K2GA85_ENTNP|nr:ribokinase, putative [Entamoeba nuttalli P19]EKE39396.1 ribokinase, putative [Entamoeba nuttalli P19]|eukprot:XP_008858271.1 ribokinase, putative [Entamoeba nuttalli P19]